MTYVDKRNGYRRTFTVEGALLSIEGRQWGRGSFHQEFSLAKMKSEPDVHRIKDETAAALGGMPGLILFIPIVIAGRVLYDKTPFGFYALLALSVTVIGIGLALGGRRRVLVFKSHEEVPLFDVTGNRRCAKELEAFATELKARIRAANSHGGAK